MQPASLKRERSPVGSLIVGSIAHFFYFILNYRTSSVFLRIYSYLRFITCRSDCSFDRKIELRTFI